MKKIFWGVLIVVAFIYCNPFTVSADDETLTPCAITSFKAVPASVSSGGSSSLKWVTTGCMTNLVTQGSTSVISSPLPSGSVSTGPLSVTKTYTLTAVGDANSATAYTTVTVGTPSVCSINSFIANPISIAYNTASVLSWATQNCTNASISPTITTVPVNGSISTGNLTQTTVFTLTASNATNTATATKTITVIPPPQCTILLFNATPLTIAYAQTTTLNWKTANCNTGLIDQGIGSITPTIIQGSVTTSPLTQTTVFKLTAVGTANTATAQITVNVAPAACTPNTWAQKADLGGSGRHEAIGFSIDNKGYIGTGYAYNGGTNKFYKDFWQYDQLANTWTQKADFAGTARMAAVGLKIGDKGYVGTGINWTTGPFDDMWEYNPLLNTWTQKASANIIGWHRSVAFSLNSKEYIGTGHNMNGPSNNFFWAYDPLVNTWTQKADFAGAGRSDAIGFALNGKGYLGTGEDDFGKKKDFWEYDPTGNTWTQKADFGGAARTEAVGFTIGSKGYVGTGNTDNSTLKDFWEYDSTLDSWTQKADFAGTARKNAIAFSIGSRGYLGTGMSGSNNYKKDLWEYCPQI
jgi:N-acetylneuraminic acid mutarotase